jgi:peptidoglycan/LPS O-acetylase OafA/YrhL
MDFYSIWPFFLILFLLLAIANSPLMQSVGVLSTSNTSRMDSIDGLRGFLAISVLFHHIAINHQLSSDGVWALPPSRFYANMGQAGVAMFFMITGFLFWVQMLKTNGKPNFVKLYIGRIFRILPVYLVLAIFTLIMTAIYTNWNLKVSLPQLSSEVLQFLAGGIFQNLTVNGYNVSDISVGVTWTLPWEWAFYASLLVTCFFARLKSVAILFPITALLIAYAVELGQSHRFPIAFILLFLSGMSIAALNSIKIRHISKNIKNLMSVGFIVFVSLAIFEFDGIYGAVQILILSLAFALVVFGSDCFGLFNTIGAKRLGDVSYGIYLLQGPLLLVVFRPMAELVDARNSALLHWIVAAITAICLLAVATVVHIYVERPGMKLGRILSNRIQSRLTPANAVSVGSN